MWTHTVGPDRSQMIIYMQYGAGTSHAG